MGATPIDTTEERRNPMTTYGDIKIATLQKMFAISGDTLVSDASTLPYIKSMPQVTNEALQLLSTAGKYITKSYEITQNPITNLLPCALYKMNIYSHTDTDVAYSAVGAKAYYFEVDNTATIEIKLDGVVIETIENTTKGKFTAYKKKISNPDGKAVEINFTGSYPYNYRNIALYGVTFETDNDVWDYVSEKRYDMRTLTTDFYQLKEIILQAGFNVMRYEKTSNFHQEGDSTIVLGGLESGSWKVIYYAYPQQITKDTPDSTVLSLDPEVAVLIPGYNASQLYKDDDASLAVLWRNEFETARAELKPNKESGTVTFVSESGW
jgi:hypothetical protein